MTLSDILKNADDQRTLAFFTAKQKAAIEATLTEKHGKPQLAALGSTDTSLGCDGKKIFSQSP